jgi:hypothetical protein
MNIPIRLSLDNNLFEEEDVDDDDDDASSIIDMLLPYKEISDRGLHDMIKVIKFTLESSYFIVVDNFTIPEYPEYGTVLGIAKDIDHFLNDD